MHETASRQPGYGDLSATVGRANELDPAIFTKPGIMVGLGERREEVTQAMDDMRTAEVDFLTIGQYLQPTRKHHPVARFVTREEFDAYRAMALAKGFAFVASSPFTRSSHHAGEHFEKLRATRDGGSKHESQLERLTLINRPNLEIRTK